MKVQMTVVLGTEELLLLEVLLEEELLLTWLELVLTKRLLLELELLLIKVELVLARKLELLELELLVELAIGSCTIATFTKFVRFLYMYIE
jgi:hypothetical protein